MTSFRLRLELPATIPDTEARRTFYWTTTAPGSVAAKLGPRHLGPSLGALGPVTEPNIEFVRLAAAVFLADRTTPRRAEGSNWSRRPITISVPVVDATRWTPIQDRLQALLAFLSGDDWTIQFEQTESPQETIADPPSDYARAVLLSGGADSAIGALLSRHELGDVRHVLVSHFGPTALPPIQRGVVARIATLLPGPDQLHRQINFTRRNKQPNGVQFANEYSTRARSLLFLALGLAVASVHGVPLWVPENGFASLNPPLGPDRRGSLSTRTTHPRLLADLSAALSEVGVHAELTNPFESATKGEMFRHAADIVGDDNASELLSRSHSCAHTGHRSLGLSLTYQCGVCFGCCVRRAAFLAACLEDRTEYLTSMKQHAKVPAYLAGKSVERSIRAFNEHGVSATDVAAMSLPDSYAGADALDLCQREIKELRGLLP